MKLKRVQGKFFAGCDGCVFDRPEECARPYGTICEPDGDIYVVDEEYSHEEQQNETKQRFNPEWGC